MSNSIRYLKKLHASLDTESDTESDAMSEGENEGEGEGEGEGKDEGGGNSDSEGDDTAMPIDPVRAAKVAFWALLRERLMVNCDSIGIEHLDKLVLATIDDPNTDAQLERQMLLLPAPTMRRPGTAPPHDIFKHSAATAMSSKRPHASSSSAKKRRTTATGCQASASETSDAPAQLVADVERITNEAAGSFKMALFRSFKVALLRSLEEGLDGGGS